MPTNDRRAVERGGRAGVPRASTCPRSTAAAGAGSPSWPPWPRSWPPRVARCWSSWCRRPSARPSSPSSAPRPRSSGGCPASPPVSSRWPSPSPSPTPAPTRTTSALTATKDGDLYRLNGPEVLHLRGRRVRGDPGGTRSGVDPDTGRGRLSLFVVDVDTPGLDKQVLPVEITAPEKQYTLFFDNVEVEADRLIGDEGEGLRQVFFGLNPERILSAATANGIGRYALDKAAEYATTREVWGTPIARHQGISHPLAKAKIEVELARLMTDKAAWYCDHDGDSPGPARRPTWPSTPRPRPPWPPSTRRSRPTGATACPPSTASPTCGAWPGCSDRAGQPRDDPQLRGPALPGAAPVVLTRVPPAGRPPAHGRGGPPTRRSYPIDSPTPDPSRVAPAAGGYHRRALREHGGRIGDGGVRDGDGPCRISLVRAPLPFVHRHCAGIRHDRRRGRTTGHRTGRVQTVAHGRALLEHHAAVAAGRGKVQGATTSSSPANGVNAESRHEARSRTPSCASDVPTAASPTIATAAVRGDVAVRSGRRVTCRRRTTGTTGCRCCHHPTH